MDIKRLTKFLWKKNAPSLGSNQLTQFSWKDDPTIYLDSNQLTKFSWKNAPQSLQVIYLRFNFHGKKLRFHKVYK